MNPRPAFVLFHWACVELLGMFCTCGSPETARLKVSRVNLRCNASLNPWSSLVLCCCRCAGVYVVVPSRMHGSSLVFGPFLSFTGLVLYCVLLDRARATTRGVRVEEDQGQRHDIQLAQRLQRLAQKGATTRAEIRELIPRPHATSPGRRGALAWGEARSSLRKHGE